MSVVNVNIQFIEDIRVYDEATKKPKLLFRKGHHAKARGSIEIQFLEDGKGKKWRRYGERQSFSPNLIVEKNGEIIYMPHRGEYVIPTDKWHIDAGRWVGDWKYYSPDQVME